MSYKIQLSRLAKRKLKDLVQHQERIEQALRSLAKAPYEASNVKKLKGFKLNTYRLRVGDYRILYRIENDEMVIFVIKIDYRKDIY